MLSIKVFGIEGCEDCETQRRMLKKSGRDYEFFDIMGDSSEVESAGIDEVPTIIIEKNGKKFRHCGILSAHKIEEAIKFLGDK